MDKNVRQWLKERDISEVEVFIPDLSGFCAVKLFLAISLYLAPFACLNPPSPKPLPAIGGSRKNILDETDGDMQLRPDVDGCFVVPWAREPTRSNHLRLRQQQRQPDSLRPA